jgi:predicted nuclease of restriction endonuclease-like (RecB) superfamily
MNFSALIQTIQQTHTALQQQAVKAINRSLTIRNWLIGYYIVEFEQKGEDRAKYGEKLLSKLAIELKEKKVSNSNDRELRRYREFYLVYPQLVKAFNVADLPENIRGTVYPILEEAIRGTVSAELFHSNNQSLAIIQTPTEQSNEISIPPDKIISRLSFSHLAELLEIKDSLKRTFYELECIKGTWSVRELKRQINSLYFERSGLSKDPQKLSALVAQKAEVLQPSDIIKSVYTFEFLGLSAKNVIEERDIETALLNHLQQFILELGHGFCFEARQQKVMIGDEYFFIDLVFYHRILKCHVLIELKVEEFNHVNAGQLNTYLAYYKKEVAQPGDNPPVGILLVTNKNKALVEYATAGMDNQLFVSKYLVQLPSKEQLQQFIQNELKGL